MERARFPGFWVLSVIPLLILLIFFALLCSVPKHQELLFSTYDFIVVAKSSRIAVFFMFNVVIITVFVGSSKPSDHQDVAGQSSTSPPALEYDMDAKDEATYDDSDVEQLDVYHGYDGYEEENDDDLDTEDDEDGEADEKDNDLERRTEELIAKVTRKWREELLTERLLFITSS